MNTRRMTNVFLPLVAMAALAVLATPAVGADTVPPTKRVLVPLMAWERGTWNAQFSAWLAAMASGGYTMEATTDAKQLSADQMLHAYDAVAMTTRSSQALDPAFQQALVEFVRQGGGLILVVTADQHAWMNRPVSSVLPTTFYRPGPGWGTAAAAGNAKLLPAGRDVPVARLRRPAGASLPAREHPALAGLDWAAAPSVSTVWRTPAPDSEFFRGTLQMLGPRDGLLKPLANANWAEILTADDAERVPAAAVCTFGRGRVLVWGAGLGGDPNKSDVPAPFTQWEGFAPLWRQIVAWA
ncbi:MAG TPA: hypothetical protein VM223_25170, partial [Planctomycetota bacterium]|nr:hypothetical protein [Planctomycetota bacterium]